MIPNQFEAATDQSSDNTNEDTRHSLLESVQCLLFENQYPVSQQEIYQFAEKDGDSEPILRDDIEGIFRQLRVKSEWKKVPWRSLDSTELPAMLMLTNGQAVTLLSLHKKYAILSVVKNTKVQQINIPLNSLKNEYTGELLTISLNQIATSSNRIRISEWISKKSLIYSVVEVLLASTMINLFQIALPLYTMNVYDKVLPNQAEETLWVLFSGVLIVLILDYVFRLMRGVVLENMSERVGEALMIRLMRKTVTANSEHKEEVGAVSDVFHEINNYRAGFFGKTFVDIIELPFFFLFFVVIYGISPQIAMIPLYASILIILVNLLHHFPLQSISKDLYPLNKNKESFLVQALSGKEGLRLSNGFSRCISQWRAKLCQALSLTRSSQLWNNSMTTTLPILVQLVSAIVVFVGAYQIFAGNLTIGGLIALTILSGRAILPILNFSSAMTRLLSSRHMLKSWKMILSRESDYDISDNVVHQTRFKGSLTVKGVMFKYPKSENNTLKSVNLQIEAGEKIGIVGPSGAGKSTLLRVLSNLEKPESGAVQLDGFSIQQIHPFEFYRNVIYMPQNPAFFCGSIYDNVRMSSQIHHQEKIDQMVDFFGLNDLMMQKSLGGGLSFEVGEDGRNLSGGQRQLVAFMRSMCNDSVIYMLDEPTSGMDGQLENQIIEYIQKYLKNKTLILVTHRPGLLHLVDNLVVMNEGKILERGTKKLMLQKYFGGANAESAYVPLKQAKIS